MTGFAILIGACKIIPPSPAAALVLVGWMFGVVPGQSYETYQQEYTHLAGQKQTAIVEQCFMDWKP